MTSANVSALVKSQCLLRACRRADGGTNSGKRAESANNRQSLVYAKLSFSTAIRDSGMSLLLFIFYWIVIPVLGLMVTLWLFSLAKSPLIKLLVIASFAAVLFGFWWLADGEKLQLDKQVRELCAKDGGVKIYETVELTPDLLDWAGRIWIPDKAHAKPSDKYYTETDIHYYRQGNPDLSRRQYRIIRRSDGKVLGELVFYGRGGGDLPGPWHDSSFTCPDPTKIPNFESSIFLKGSRK